MKNYEITEILNKGKELILGDDYYGAIKVLEKLAKAGNAEAQYYTGLCFEELEEYKKAVKWLKKAVKNNSDAAKIKLGNIYLDIFDNVSKAIDCFEDFADNGNLLAEEGMARCLFENGHYMLAERYMLKAAEHGTPETFYMLGQIYELNPDDPDLEKAKHWYKTAAEQGNAEAKEALLRLNEDKSARTVSASEIEKYYASGNDSYNAGDFKQAAIFYRRAAENGHVGAQSRLGRCYFDGKGVKRDYAQAVEWLTKAAESGEPEAQDLLGKCYAKGLGVQRDGLKAVYWITSSVRQKVLKEQSDMLQIDYESNQPFDVLIEKAERGDASAQFQVGLMYLTGKGIARNDNSAFKWFKTAAEQGNCYAQSNLGYCYRYGLGVTANYGEALKWYRTAANSGSDRAFLNVGLCMLNGIGTKKNISEAVAWLKKAAEKGNADAQYMLGSIYQKGDGVDKDTREAIKWYRKAADQGNDNAQYNLGCIYYKGDGVEQDRDEGMRLFESAAANGNEYAQRVLSDLND